MIVNHSKLEKLRGEIRQTIIKEQASSSHVVKKMSTVLLVLGLVVFGSSAHAQDLSDQIHEVKFSVHTVLLVCVVIFTTVGGFIVAVQYILGQHGAQKSFVSLLVGLGIFALVDQIAIIFNEEHVVTPSNLLADAASSILPVADNEDPTSNGTDPYVGTGGGQPYPDEETGGTGSDPYAGTGGGQPYPDEETGGTGPDPYAGTGGGQPDPNEETGGTGPDPYAGTGGAQPPPLGGPSTQQISDYEYAKNQAKGAAYSYQKQEKKVAELYQKWQALKDVPGQSTSAHNDYEEAYAELGPLREAMETSEAEAEALNPY